MATALLAGMKAQERKIQELDRAITEASPPAGGEASTNAWAIDQSTGKVSVNFFGDINMQGNSILDIKKITGYLGKWSIDEEGTLMAVRVITNEVITKKLAVSESATFGAAAGEVSPPAGGETSTTASTTPTITTISEPTASSTPPTSESTATSTTISLAQ